MSTVMTPEELDAIEKRASRAVPGPWEDAEGSVWGENDQRVVDEAFVRRPGDNIAIASQILNPCADPQNAPSQDTAAFIAHAREDVPALVAEVRRLRAELARIATQRDTMRAILDGRTTPPTDAELAEHARAGGRWRAQTFGSLVADCMGVRLAEAVRDNDRDSGITRRWWATTENGTLCTWPKVTP